MTTAELVLTFAPDQSHAPELIETRFTHPVLPHPAVCVRGKSSGAYRGCATFQWTRAVQALTKLLVRAKLDDLGGCAPGPHLAGAKGTLVTALDYAIAKQPLWLMDMSGTVLETFDEYLNCGLLQHGAARVYCETCKHSLRVAFSCKIRGLCASCNAKRVSIN